MTPSDDPKIRKLERKVLRAAEVWFNTKENGNDTTYQIAILGEAVMAWQEAKQAWYLAQIKAGDSR